MEALSAKIVSRMVMEEIITGDEVAIYLYSIQLMLERMVSYAIIGGLAILLRSFLPILIFSLSFSLIRTFSGGYHCNRFSTCLVLSMLVALSVRLVFPLVDMFYAIYQGGVIMSILIVILIGSINNLNIDWSYSEYKRAKTLSRFVVGLEIFLLFILNKLGIPRNYCFYISYGIVVSAVSMLFEIRKRGGLAYEGY